MTLHLTKLRVPHGSLVSGAGYAALASLIGVTILAFQGLAGFDDARFDTSLLSDSYTLKILRFSLWQALLSTLLAVALAWPLARILHRFSFKGTGLLLKLCLLAFITPTLVVITAILVLFGPQGLLRPLIGEEWKLFGLNGILLAHIYLNFPLALRVLFQRYQALPQGTARLCAQLKLSALHTFFRVEWPQVRPALLSVSGLIFILCFNSFAVVLALGGGPSATTFELAIYQALKYQFNLSEALTLAWMQFAIAGGLFALIALLGKVQWLGASRSGGDHWQPPAQRATALAARCLYLLCWTVLLMPLFALMSSIDWGRIFMLELAPLLSAVTRSLVLALSATLIALLLSLLVTAPQLRAIQAHRTLQAATLQWVSTHHLVAPAMVLSTGLYILLLSEGLLRDWSLVCLIGLNALLILPFMQTQLRPAIINYHQQYWRLSTHLKLSLYTRSTLLLRYLALPLLSVFALGLLLALGDVSVFAIFGQYNAPTLPWLIYSYAGSYRLNEAAFAATLLLFLCIALLLLIERSGSMGRANR